MVEKQILDTIHRYDLIKKHQHIVLGLSGGPDSVCLFHVLSELAPVHQWTIHPVHINHLLRPGAAEADQVYVEKICQAAGWPCRVFRYDCNAIAEEEKMTAEEAGRKVRYEAFAQVAAEVRASGVKAEDICIAVAQNAEDQAETILFRLLRGAGTDGLSGIHYERRDEENNRIIRPLLDVKRSDILRYCQEHNLQPQMDHTNEKPVYTRNKIRLELIPYLAREYNPAISDTMIRMGKSAAVDSDYLWQQTQKALKNLVIEQSNDEILLSGAGLRDVHQAIRKRVLSCVFARLGLTADLTASHFEACETIVFHSGSSARCDLPKGFYLSKVYENVKAGRQPFFDGGGKEKVLPAFSITVMDAADYAVKGCSKARAVFDYEKLSGVFGEKPEERIAMDTRRAGDFIPLRHGRSKKIQDYFVDQKVPRDVRDAVPMLKIGREVLWILPETAKGWGKGRFSAEYRVESSTKKVICIEIIC